METATIIGLIVAFLFSFSILLNILLAAAVGGAAWYTKKSLVTLQQLEEELVEANSRLFISESIEEIINHILQLEEILFEVSEMEVYTQEPTIMELSAQVKKTLEGIKNSVVAQEYEKALEEINE